MTVREAPEAAEPAIAAAPTKPGLFGASPGSHAPEFARKNILSLRAAVVYH
jgi:hypothetical protein